jgi:hypothetical protein
MVKKVGMDDRPLRTSWVRDAPSGRFQFALPLSRSSNGRKKVEEERLLGAAKLIIICR